MKRLSLCLLTVLTFACPAMKSMENTHANSTMRIMPVAQAKLVATKIVNNTLSLFIPNITAQTRQTTLATIFQRIAQHTSQNTISTTKFQEIMLEIAREKNINAEDMQTAVTFVLMNEENKPMQSQAANSNTRFHPIYGTVVLINKSLAHFPLVHLYAVQQGHDLTCGLKAIANAHAINALLANNEPICSELVRARAIQYAQNQGYNDMQDNLASDELRELANIANIHNCYILDAQAYGAQRHYEVCFGDTQNGMNADPIETANMLEIELRNLAALAEDNSGSLHFFCNTARKTVNGNYASGHWILISIVKEAHKPVVIFYQDSANNLLQLNTLNHLYLHEIIAMCRKHGHMFTNLLDEVEATMIDRAVGLVPEEATPANNNNNNNAPQQHVRFQPQAPAQNVRPAPAPAQTVRPTQTPYRGQQTNNRRNNDQPKPGKYGRRR